MLNNSIVANSSVLASIILGLVILAILIVTVAKSGKKRAKGNEPSETGVSSGEQDDPDWTNRSEETADDAVCLDDTEDWTSSENGILHIPPKMRPGGWRDEGKDMENHILFSNSGRRDVWICPWCEAENGKTRSICQVCGKGGEA